MKTNICILIILIFSFSALGAQNETKITHAEKTVKVSETTQTTLSINTKEIKVIIVKSSSDIRIYLNRERNVENIKLVFPKINKRKVA